MRRYPVIFLLFFLFMSCVKNDIPYPRIVPNIVSMTVEGGTVDIDASKRLVTITLEETVNYRYVNITDVKIDKEDVKLSEEIKGVHNMREPWTVILTTYQNYPWTIVAQRPIERYFTVEGQVGASVIDVVNRRAIAYVSKLTPLNKIKITSLKLGPKNITTYSPSWESIRKFVDADGNPTYVEIAVSSFEDTEDWKLFVERSDVSINVKSVNAWTHEAYITASGVAGQNNGFKYRIKGAGNNWTAVPESSITHDGGEFTAQISELEPSTVYEFYAFTGSDMTEVLEFTTDADSQMPNSSFEYVSKVSGKDYYKWYDPSCAEEEGKTMFWGSGNGEGAEGVNGSASMGVVITVPDENEKVDGERSVRAQSSSIAGMLAAGNIFTGNFAGLVGTSGGKVRFGRPWTTRPTAVRLYVKYTASQINIVKSVPEGVVIRQNEDYDRASIQIALGTWDYRKYGGTKESPVLVNTANKSTFVDYNKDESTIANAELILYGDGYEQLNNGEKVPAETSQWRQVTIPLKYHTKTVKPTHIIVSCAASKYGDYFTGSDDAKLWIDKVELVY